MRVPFFHAGESNPQQIIRDKTSHRAIIPLVKTPVGILLLLRQWPEEDWF